MLITSCIFLTRKGTINFLYLLGNGLYMNFSKQEEFWEKDFGNQYISRNKSKNLLDSNINYFKNIFDGVDEINSCIEFGSNIGLNLLAIRTLYPSIKPLGIEINSLACAEMEKENVPHLNESFLNDKFYGKFDLTFTKGVLIHINPNLLNLAYSQLYRSSNKYILLCEYYNNSPVTVPYRGFDEVLFKRDFAGDMLDLYSDLKLVKYGFSYIRDDYFQDDITFFLLEKSI